VDRSLWGNRGRILSENPTPDRSEGEMDRPPASVQIPRGSQPVANLRKRYRCFSLVRGMLEERLLAAFAWRREGERVVATDMRYRYYS
jgi:hypothetical protein